MSRTVRIALATAASTVPGISCSPYYHQDTTPGTAYVRLERINYPNPFGGVVHWNVVVLLPQDIAQAEEYLEELLPQLHTALESELVITSAVPQRVEFPGVGVLPALFINGHREA